MKASLLLAVMLAAAPAAAGPAHLSRDPRIGVLGEIHFATGSAVVAAGLSTDKKLGRAIGWAERNPDGVIVLGGHADRTGAPAANVELSLRRTEAVRDRLVAAGLPPSRIVIAAYGAHGPLRANPAENRRVTLAATHRSSDELLAVLSPQADVVATGETGALVVSGRTAVAGR